MKTQFSLLIVALGLLLIPSAYAAEPVGEAMVSSNAGLYAWIGGLLVAVLLVALAYWPRKSVGSAQMPAKTEEVEEEKVKEKPASEPLEQSSEVMEEVPEKKMPEEKM